MGFIEFIHHASTSTARLQRHGNCKCTAEEQKKQNYLLRKNNKFFVVIRNDKVIKSHGPDQFELPNELNNVIYESLEAFPRKYILSTQRDGDRPIGKQGFESLLRQCFSPQRVTVDILRSSYILTSTVIQENR